VLASPIKLEGRLSSEYAPSHPRSVAFDPVSTCLLISHGDGLLTWFDLVKRVVLADLHVGPYGLSNLEVLPHQRSCIGISGSERAMYLIASEQRAVRWTVRFAEGPGCLLPDPVTDTIFVACLSQQRDLLYTIDGATGNVRNRAPIGRAAMELAIDPRRQVLFVVNNLAASISFIDTRTGALLDTVGLPSFPTGLALDVAGRRLFASTVEAGLVVLRTGDGGVIAHLTSDQVYGAIWGDLPLLGGIGFDAEAERVVLGYRQSQGMEPPCAVTILDSRTYTVVARHDLSGMVMAVRVHGGKHHAYVLYQTRHETGKKHVRVLTLQVLDTRTGSILLEEPVAKHPLDVLLVESRNQLFIADFDENAVICVEDL
jgi:DNA-binding beta-propeller fold protein YncE